MKKCLLVLFVILLIGLFSCKGSNKEMFIRYAQEETSKCPHLVNEFTRIDSVVYQPNMNTNTYYYTLIKAADNLLAIEQNKVQMEKELINGIINSVELNIYKENNVIMHYVYYSEKNKTVLLNIKITPEQYK